MAPYRPSGQRRSGRAYVDHDVFEGLPVRHWRRQNIVFGAPTKAENNGGNRGTQTELPMPKDAHLLCPMSQALLQAARAGRVNNASPSGASGGNGGAGDDEAKAAGDEDDVVTGREEGDKAAFVAMRWQLVPRHLEGPEVEYLAKRRKGLRSSTRGGRSGAGDTSGGSVMKRVTIRRTDVDGNTVTEDVLMAEGQTIDGEILAEVTVTDANGGTLVDGVGVVNADGFVVSADSAQATPNRRRPPPPRRKPKGPGRGRKKKVQFVPGTEGVQAVMEVGTAEGTPQAETGPTAAGIVPDQSVAQATGIKEENTLKVPQTADVEMGEDSTLQEGEDDEEEEGEEGEAEEDDDKEEGELSPSPEEDGYRSSASPVKPPPPPAPKPAMPAAALPPVHHPPPQPQPQPQPQTQPPPPPPQPQPQPQPQLQPIPSVVSPTRDTVHHSPLTPSSSLTLNPTGLRHPLPPKPAASISFAPPPRRASTQLPPPRPLQGVEIHKPGGPGIARDAARGHLPHMGSPVKEVPSAQPMRERLDVIMTDNPFAHARDIKERRGSAPFSAGPIISPPAVTASSSRHASPTSQHHLPSQPQPQLPISPVKAGPAPQLEQVKEELPTTAAVPESTVSPASSSAPSTALPQEQTLPAPAPTPPVVENTASDITVDNETTPVQVVENKDDPVDQKETGELDITVEEKPQREDPVQEPAAPAAKDENTEMKDVTGDTSMPQTSDVPPQEDQAAKENDSLENVGTRKEEESNITGDKPEEVGASRTEDTITMKDKPEDAGASRTEDAIATKDKLEDAGALNAEGDDVPKQDGTVHDDGNVMVSGDGNEAGTRNEQATGISMAASDGNGTGPEQAAVAVTDDIVKGDDAVPGSDGAVKGDDAVVGGDDVLKRDGDGVVKGDGDGVVKGDEDGVVKGDEDEAVKRDGDGDRDGDVEMSG